MIEEEQEEDGSSAFIVSFPDLDNVFTEGDTLVEAVKHAGEVLVSMLWIFEEKGIVFSPPSPVSILKDRLKEGDSLVLIEVDTVKDGLE
ncbi:type II toxin-antitoxin system HicB family antitoxin [Rossellomorea marisflavi]|uniref:type II toxin-antitoxin system HicB family antitoxin n=1 Tax=Rossellomorea marisflavi TaxID=189381 RepID=UPI0027AAB5D6|nr:type II toxin-antitoxin system HicB family antitoxin [Rossellomorea marisflavi]UTE72040.1 type II toxin-antitoxin system HicB family antitoxin [Rossellomorea marisflavi]